MGTVAVICTSLPTGSAGYDVLLALSTRGLQLSRVLLTPTTRLQGNVMHGYTEVHNPSRFSSHIGFDVRAARACAARHAKQNSSTLSISFCISGPKVYKRSVKRSSVRTTEVCIPWRTLVAGNFWGDDSFFRNDLCCSLRWRRQNVFGSAVPHREL